MWPDVELVVTRYLRARLGPGVRVVNELPSALETRLPLVCVILVDGDDDRITDAADVDVESYAATRTAMWELAERARSAMAAAEGTWVEGMVVDSVETIARPHPVTYSNPAVRKAVSTHRLTSRAQAPA